MTPSYGTSPVKRTRATNAELAERREALRGVVLTDGPMSCRHAYYRAVVLGLVEKTEAGYRKVQRALLDMRRDGTIPYDLVVDNTRWMRKATTWRSLEDMLRDAARFYRRDLWAQAVVRLEVWCESDSIAGTIADITDRWDVPLMVCRGFSSETFTYSAAEAWSAEPDRIPAVLYIGDHDPAGLEIEQNLRAKLEKFYEAGTGFEDAVLWSRIGVNVSQVILLDLYDVGTVPKKPYGFPLAWEAEALPAPYLRRELETAIESFVDRAALKAIHSAEQSEREVLVEIASAKGGAR